MKISSSTYLYFSPLLYETDVRYIHDVGKNTLCHTCDIRMRYLHTKYKNNKNSKNNENSKRIKIKYKYNI